MASTGDGEKEQEKPADAEAAAEQLHVHRVEQTPLVDTQTFSVIMGCVVVCNVICIGFETEFAATSGSELFGAINNGFLLTYIIELMMRTLTHGMKAFRDPYTVMDLILVFLAFSERIMSASGMARALPTFRMLRLGRLLRQTRFFRHQRELRAIATASVRMIRTLAWVVIFMFIFLWSLATFAHIVIGKSAEWNETMDPNRTFEPFVPLDIDEYFGSVWRSFISLLQVVTLSQWAPHIARPIFKVYPVTFLFFMFFIFATSYGLLLAVISNLVQDSMAASRENAKAIKEKEREERRKAGMKAQDILAEVDADGSGELDVHELAYALEITNLEEILRDLGVPVTDAESLVQLLDYNGNGTVSYSELVEGIVKMDDDITKRDYAMMGFWVKNLLHRTTHLEARLATLCDEISFIRKKLTGCFGALNHMIATAKDSELRQRSIHILRTTGPALPPSIEKKEVWKASIPRMEPKLELQNFASRFLGEPPKPKRAGSPGLDEPDRGTSCFRNTLGDAPPRVEVGRKRAKQAEMAWRSGGDDKYALNAKFPTENLNLKALKRTL